MDSVARLDSPLPASSLKGAMRAACSNVLDVAPTLVASIFGREGHDSDGAGAWAWTHAGPRSAFRPQLRARNRIDAETGVAKAEALTVTEEWWQANGVDAAFAAEQVRVLEPAELQRHVVVLQVAAYAVTALGSWRNRGMGTVTVRPVDQVENLAQQWQQVTR